MRFRSVLRVSSAVAFALSTAVVLAAEAKEEPEPAVPLDAVLPMLVRDDGVRRELGLTPTQARAVDRLLEKWNERLFRLRMLSPKADREEITATLSGFGGSLSEALDEKQRARLKGLKLQANGWRSLLDPAVAGELRLSDSQRQKVVSALRQTGDAVRKLKRERRPGAEDDQAAELRRLTELERDRVVRVLSQTQQRQWLDLVGEKYDLTKVEPAAGSAPELKGIAGWLNSEPLTIRGLRGRVVVLHFVASDCVNCVRNLPHYEGWHEKFSGRGVVVLGVHSPETDAERDAKHVEWELTRRGVTYPVALDAEGETWDAWANRTWPSTYLIDKRGRVRFWWYGELEWRGAGGEKLMRDRIEALLAEKGETGGAG
jgi:peroxiredoxin